MLPRQDPLPGTGGARVGAYLEEHREEEPAGMRMLQEIRKLELFAPPRDHDPHHDQQQDPAQPRQPESTSLGCGLHHGFKGSRKAKTPEPYRIERLPRLGITVDHVVGRGALRAGLLPL